MKALAIVRDVAVIGLFCVACFVAVSVHNNQLEQERTRTARLVAAQSIISALDGQYKKAVFEDTDNKGIYQQMFRQNEVMLEYQKALLTIAYLPAPTEGAVPALRPALQPSAAKE